MSFEKLDLIEPILNALKSEGYTHPTPIQEVSIPIILKGRDLLGCAQTGTGKTAAFAIPIIQQLVNQKGNDKIFRKIQVLIVTPTRELAIQIDESFASYGKYTKLRHTVVFGGVNQTSQVASLKAGVDILVATPGRLLDLINQGYIRLNELKIFVLDEADRMLDMGFIHDVKRIIKVIPNKRQSLFFSATMPDSIVSLANSILTNPEKVEVTPVSSTAETVKQEVYFVDTARKKDLLIHTLKDQSIITALVFTKTKHGADKVVKFLVKENIIAEAIHGNKSQNARQKALKNFKDRTTRVLVATDIAARGIDIDDLTLVINYEIPNISETYVHRIGRTGRAGSDGKAISFCDAEERAYLKDIQKLILFNIPVVENHPYPAEQIHPDRKSKEKPQQNMRSQNSNRRPQGTRSSTLTNTIARRDERTPSKNWGRQSK
ncbi:MAG: DEAD/DEAH box helicase [Bacteroidota bacterium]